MRNPLFKEKTGGLFIDVFDRYSDLVFCQGRAGHCSL